MSTNKQENTSAFADKAHEITDVLIAVADKIRQSASGDEEQHVLTVAENIVLTALRLTLPPEDRNR